MEYFEEVLKVFNEINNNEKESMNKAGEILSKTIINGGLIYIFGCGHSHLLGLDCFYRAGGLCNVYPILKEELMLHKSASLSSKLEKDENSAICLLDKYNITEKDCLIVISTSGKNGAPVQVAIDGLKKNINVISICSSNYFCEKSKHSSGKLLKDVCNVCIDNHVPHGDATQLIGDIMAGAISTIVTSYIMQNVMLIAERLAIKSGVKPDIFLSGNIDGGEKFNKSLIEKYKPLIDCL